MLQNTDEWLEYRRKRIGASDAPIIMGVSPYSTPFQLWEVKQGFRPDQEENEAMRRGKNLETEAREEFFKQTGILVEPMVRLHPDIPWMMASLDGIDSEDKVLVEIKCPGKYNHEQAMDGVVPAKFYPQLQHQMEVCDLDSMFYFSYNPSSSKILKVERDKGYTKGLIQKEKEFYKCMQESEPPPLTEKDYIVRNDAKWVEVAERWKLNQLEMSRLEDQAASIRQELLCLASSKNCQGAGLRISKVAKKGNINYKSIPQLKKVDLEQHRSPPTQYWRISKTE